MGSIINIFIEELEEGKIFGKDELIIDKWKNGMMTIRKEADYEEIKVFYYDFFDVHDGFVHDNGCGEIYSNDIFYKDYKQKLIDHNLWGTEKFI